MRAKSRVLMIVSIAIISNVRNFGQSPDKSIVVSSILNECIGEHSQSGYHAYFQFEDGSWELHDAMQIQVEENRLQLDTIFEFKGRYGVKGPLYDTCYPTTIHTQKHVILDLRQGKSARVKFTQRGDTIFYDHVLCDIRARSRFGKSGIAYVLDTTISTQELFRTSYYVDSCGSYVEQWIKYTGEKKTIQVGHQKRSAYVFKRQVNRLSTGVVDLTNEGLVYIDCAWMIPVFPSRGDRLPGEAPIQRAIQMVSGSSSDIGRCMERFDHPNLSQSNNDAADPWNRYLIVFAR